MVHTKQYCMKTKKLNQVNLFTFKIVMCLIFGCTSVYGQLRFKKNSLVLKNSNSAINQDVQFISSSDLKLTKKIKNFNPKKVNFKGVQSLFKSLRIGLLSTHFQSFSKRITLNSGFVYYTLKNPLKTTAFNSSSTLNVGFSFKANF